MDKASRQPIGKRFRGFLPVVVSLCGTDADPQDRAACERTLAGAGASVFLSNAAAARHAVASLRSTR